MILMSMFIFILILVIFNLSWDIDFRVDWCCCVVLEICWWVVDSFVFIFLRFFLVFVIFLWDIVEFFIVVFIWLFLGLLLFLFIVLDFLKIVLLREIIFWNLIVGL